MYRLLFLFVAIIFEFNICYAYKNGTLWPGKDLFLEVNASSGYLNPKWSVSNPTVSLSGSGFYRNVRANAYFSGTCIITCSYDYYVGTSKYSNKTTWEYDCADNHISITPKEITLKLNSKKNISWSFAWETYMQPLIQFSGYDHSIMNISSDGVITSKSVGSTILYVKSNLGSNTETCKITVTGDNSTGDGTGNETTGNTRKIELEEGGTLSNYISDDEKYSITELYLSGPLNGTDLRLLREMSGSDYNRHPTGGKLKILDLSEVYFVEGGAWYIDYFGTKYFTESSFDFPVGVFAYCNSLTKVFLPKRTNNIKYGAFLWCKNLEFIDIPVGVRIIGKNNFTYCKLNNIKLPSTIISIETDFYESTNLTDVYCRTIRPSNVNFIKTNIENGKLYVPKGTSNSYWKSENWNRFNDIVEQDQVYHPIFIYLNEGGSLLYDNKELTKKSNIASHDKYVFEIVEGGNVIIKLEPESGYEIESVYLNEKEMTSSIKDNELIVSDFNKESILYVNFIPKGSGINKCTIEEKLIEIEGNWIKFKYPKNKIFTLDGFIIAENVNEIYLNSGLYIVKIGNIVHKLNIQ